MWTSPRSIPQPSACPLIHLTAAVGFIQKVIGSNIGGSNADVNLCSGFSLLAGSIQFVREIRDGQNSAGFKWPNEEILEILSSKSRGRTWI
jgi:hypothetical protein